ncbi:MFS transporter [Mangrovibacillus cuniculi]|uniref:MFS transporter n=1 Tax=Mangrovibacillus cuniculi TaxID=2593652 RepID=A0A7S8CB82_9BACI|nr:MFS transporter [Mangrovibacillus cuniculi]QPC46779.1 MFS transporter [Mangrovibacillus cuniculi]
MKSNLWLLLIGKFASVFASSLFTFVAGLTVLKNSESGLQFALVLLAGTLPRVLLSPIAGVYADRLDRRKVIISMESSSALLFFVAGISSIFIEFTLPVFLLISFTLTTLSTFLSVTLTSSIPLLIEKDQLQKANSLMQSIASGSSIGSPIIAGALFLIVPIPFFLISSSILFGISAILAAKLSFVKKVKKEEKTPMKEELKSGFRYLQKNRPLWVLSITAAFLNFFFIAQEVLFPIVAVKELKLSAFQFGFLESTFAVGFLLAALLHATPALKIIYPLATTRYSLFVMSILFIGPAIPLVVPMSKSFIILFFVLQFLLMGFFVMRTNMPIQLYIQTKTDPAYLGRVMGVLESLAMGIMPLGMVLFGILSDIVPIQWLFVGCTASLLVITILAALNLTDEIKEEKEENSTLVKDVSLKTAE